MMKNKLRKQALVSCSALMLLAGGSIAQSATLLSENFEGATGPFPYVSCGYNCSHAVDVGVAVTSTAAFGTTGVGSNDYAAGASNDWYAAVFEADDDGYVATDVGIQATGGGTNSSRVGLVKDDSGMLISIDTTGQENLSLSFDWRTFAADSGDELVVGYFVGDLTAGKTTGFNAWREINLSPTGNASTGLSGGPAEDGAWNWNPVNGANSGNWVELFRSGDNGSWDSETLSFGADADNQSEVWLAVWLDNGNHDIGKFDNLVVTSSPIPVPATLWLLGSGLLGFVGIARRKNS